MPELRTTLSLNDKTPSELEARRREIVSDLTTKYRGYDDPEVPMDLLHELVGITATLRRKTAGPPKVAKTRTPTKSATIDDLGI